MSDDQIKKTSIIIAVSNHDYSPCHYTGNMIGSVKEHTDPEKTPYELIVIDNGSTIELGGWKWDQVVDKYVKWDENKGVAKAWNHGLEISDGYYVGILNNDIMVFDHWLEDLQDSLKYVHVVSATPMYDCPWGRASEAATRRQEWISKAPSAYLSDFEDFCCTLTTRDIFESIGKFDETFFAYKEDIDWKYRVREAKGVIKSDKRVNIHHIGGATSHTLVPRLDGGWEKWNQTQVEADKYLKEKWQIDEHGNPKFVKTYYNGA